MTRGEWHAEARWLWDAHPEMTLRDIASQLGVTNSAVYKVLHPERARAYSRRDNERPERIQAKRAWDRRSNETFRTSCEVCGGECGKGSGKSRARRCSACIADLAVARLTIFAGMYNEGWPLKDIADVWGRKGGGKGLGPELLAARGAGLIGYRHRGWA